MAEFWQTIGHSAAKALLRQQLEADSFPHAYLFIGPEAVGKRSVALELAQRILKTDRLDTHPDFRFADARAEGFGVEQARTFMTSLESKPFMGGRTIALLDNVEAINVQSGNALLKGIEEPKPSVILFLIANTSHVLPTIRSRCQVVSFGPLGEPELNQFLATLPQSVEQDLITLAGGAPGRIAELVVNSEHADELRQNLRRLEELEQQPLSYRLAAVPELAELEAEKLERLLELWLYRRRRQLAANPSGYTFVRLLVESLIQLHQNINKKLILQRLCMALG